MPARVKLETVGFAAALKSLKRVRDQGSKAHRRAIDAMTKAVFNLSQDYCPVDTGDLKSNAYWEGEFGTETYRRDIQSTYVTYIVYPEPYAVFVHECVGHFHEPPTSAKFIQRAVEELFPELNQIAGKAYQNAFFVEFSKI